MANLADPNARDRNGNTPAHLILLLKYLRGSFAELSTEQQDRETKQSIEALKLLKEHGADFAQKNKNDVSVYDLLSDQSVPTLVKDGVK